MTILVTGGSGFVGRPLCRALVQSGYRVRAALRRAGPIQVGASETVLVGHIGASTDWSAALKGVDAIIHTAAIAHVLKDANAASAYAETNDRGTWRLAGEASRVGVRRFIYLSSVKVNGERTFDAAYTADDDPQPEDQYALSKWGGERHLMDIAATTGMEVGIVRAPLVYGPGVRANFLRLLQWVDSGWPLPLGAVRNSRSIVSIWNLCDLLQHLLKAPSTHMGRTWMVSDGEDLSTPELIRRIGRAMNRGVLLLPVPVSVLKALAATLRVQREMDRLCASLVVDIDRTRNELGWSPPVSTQEALQRTVNWYLERAQAS